MKLDTRSNKVTAFSCRLILPIRKALQRVGKSRYIAPTLEKLPSGGRWYAPKCVTPVVTAWGHSNISSIVIITMDKAGLTFHLFYLLPVKSLDYHHHSWRLSLCNKKVKVCHVKLDLIINLMQYQMQIMMKVMIIRR